MATGLHLFPFRTEKLSPSAPMVLGGQPPGRVGRRRINLEEGRREAAFFVVLEWWMMRGEGVVLRPWRLDDVPAVTAACQDCEIARWLAFVPEPCTEEDARFYIQDCIGAPDDRKPFATRRRDGAGHRLDRHADQSHADGSRRVLARRAGE